MNGHGNASHRYSEEIKTQENGYHHGDDHSSYRNGTLTYNYSDSKTVKTANKQKKKRRSYEQYSQQVQLHVEGTPLLLNGSNANTSGGTNGGNSNSYNHHHHQQQPPPQQQQRQQQRPNKRSVFARQNLVPTTFVILLSIVTLALGLRVLVSSAALSFLSPSHHRHHHYADMDGNSNPFQNGHYEDGLFDDQNRFILQDYDVAPPFSDFLPGVAGIYGKPLWSFYINRAQGMASFGFLSKQFPLQEFDTANKAYQSVPLLGFRTFVKIKERSRRRKQKQTLAVASGGGTYSDSTTSTVVEPFSPMNSNFQKQPHLPKRTMYVGDNEVQFQETDSVHKLETNVTFFTLPEEDFGALVKRTTITNLDSSNSIVVDILDGLTKLEPAGGELNNLLKTMGRTLEAWMAVDQAHPDTNTMPFYRLSTTFTSMAGDADFSPPDYETAGHYVLCVLEDDKMPRLLPVVFDTNKIFGEDTTLLHPAGFVEKDLDEILKAQYGHAKTPSGFAGVSNYEIPPGESITVASFFGKAQHIMDVPVISRRLTQIGFVQYKYSRGRELIRQITSAVDTRTSSILFNAHIQQMFLDNSLRGGIPVLLGEVDDQARMKNADEDPRLKVYHLFSRTHGDLERDQHDFQIRPTFFSQGAVNFRDVVLNRRNDVIFNPRIGSFNARMFLSFLQADAYEPFFVDGVLFSIHDKSVCLDIATRAVGHADGVRAQRELMTGLLSSGPFQPGNLFQIMEDNHIELMMTRKDFIHEVAAAATITPNANYEHGFWSDHWDYYMDMINSYLAIYPDEEFSMLFEHQLPYFFSPATVQPRSKKYVLETSPNHRRHYVRQLNATLLDGEKGEILLQSADRSNKNDIGGSWQYDQHGNIFKSTAFEKLFLLAALKFATRDPYGMGVEYESGKPGFLSALDGLPAMMGSGMPETHELDILLKYLVKVTERYNHAVKVPEELYTLISAVDAAIDTLDAMTGNTTIDEELDLTVPEHLFQYWNNVSTARETYREQTRLHFGGAVKMLLPDTVQSILSRWIEQLEQGKARAVALGYQGSSSGGGGGKGDLTPTYFSYEVTKWEETGEGTAKGDPFVTALEFKVSLLPLFLEGPTKLMKSMDKEGAKDIYAKIRASELHDRDLGMYTMSGSLEGMSSSYGHMTASTPGWLENQSVWSHMSYKLYLELLRKGMVDEFFKELVSGGMLPYMKPGTYGRSLVQCSSFIASSAFEDPSVRGRGFLARLSGSTAEFLSMWALMMLGAQPFILDPETQQVQMKLVPTIPLWLFKDDGKISFKLFGGIDVTYHNELGENLYNIEPTRYQVGFRDGSMNNIEGSSIPNDLATKIRRIVFVDSVQVYFTKKR